MKKISLTLDNAVTVLPTLKNDDILQTVAQMVSIIFGIKNNIVKMSNPCNRDCNVGTAVINYVTETVSLLELLGEEIEKRGLSDDEEFASVMGAIKSEISHGVGPVEIQPKKKEVFH